MQRHFTDECRKQVKNRGQAQAWYIEDDHQRIVSDNVRA